MLKRLSATAERYTIYFNFVFLLVGVEESIWA